MSAAPSMVSTWVTSGWFSSFRIRRPSSTLLPSRRTTSGLVGRVAEDLQGTLDAVGDLVARGDATEHVDEHALDLLVVEDHVETVGHHGGVGAAADVEEVGRLHAAVVLTGVRDDVQRRHDQARAVADDAHGTVELHVVEPEVLRLRLQRVGLFADLEGGVLGVTELGVLVERDLAVERLELVAGQPRERVDLDQGGVLLGEDGPQLLDHGDRLVAKHGGEADLVDDGGRLGLVDTGAGVDRDHLHRVGVGLGDLFDLHTTLDTGDAEVGTVGAVEQEGEVVLLLDRGAGDHEHPVDRETLDLELQDRAGCLLGFLGRLGDLDATCLATATGLDLGLDDDDATDLLGGRASVLRSFNGDAEGASHSVLREDFLRLVLHQVHDVPSPFRVLTSGISTRHPRPVARVTSRLGSVALITPSLR